MTTHDQDSYPSTPTHPGEVLLREFIEPMGMTPRELASGIRVPHQRIDELVCGKCGVTASTALRLARFLGNSPGFWMSLQARWDLYRTLRASEDELSKIETFSGIAGIELDEVMAEADRLLDPELRDRDT